MPTRIHTYTIHIHSLPLSCMAVLPSILNQAPLLLGIFSLQTVREVLYVWPSADCRFCPLLAACRSLLTRCSRVPRSVSITRSGRDVYDGLVSFGELILSEPIRGLSVAQPGKFWGRPGVMRRQNDFRYSARIMHRNDTLYFCAII